MSNSILQQEPQNLAGSSNNSSDSEEYQKKMAEIDQLMSEAKKLSLTRSLGDAADKYELAVKTATHYFGDFVHECFQPALDYGKILIEITRLDSQPINTLERIDETNENEDGEDSQTGKDGEVQGTKKNQTMEEKSVEPEHAEAEEQTFAKEEQKNQADETLPKENGENNSTVDDEEEGEEGDDIQTAWEWLEVARKICEKQEESAYWQENKSNVLLALGECMTVAEEFQQALEEFFNALEIRQKIFATNDRRIAEVYFFIGLTYGNLDEFDKAAEQFELAKHILLRALEAKQKEQRESLKNVELGGLIEEIVELKDVIGSIEDNIRDARESAESRALQKAMQSELLPTTKQLPSNCPDANTGIEVSDLSGLVKRKPVKRPIGEDEDKHTNGISAEKANGVTNGISDAIMPLQQKRTKLDTEETN